MRDGATVRPKKALDEMSVIYLWYAKDARQMRNINGRQS